MPYGIGATSAAGGASAAYGSDAMAGVVNIITRNIGMMKANSARPWPDPEDRRRALVKTNEVRIVTCSAGSSSFGSTRRSATRRG